MSTLVFFDINGTLIKRDERTDIPYSNAVNRLLKTENIMDGVDTSARSDKDVFMEVLRKAGLVFSEQIWNEFLAMYVKELEKFSTTDVWRENADAVPFVKEIAAGNITMALITGELSVGAEYKLKKIGIWECFLAGGYGEDGLKRFDIAEKAFEKVKRATNRSYELLYVIGDTILDIQTARHLGAKSIAITTGSHSREKLMSEKPDYCIDIFQEVRYLFLNQAEKRK